MMKPIARTSAKRNPMEGSEQIPDRNALKETCIDPLDPEQHPADGLVNIVTEKVTTELIRP
jgi:hypothetical protein